MKEIQMALKIDQFMRWYIKNVGSCNQSVKIKLEEIFLGATILRINNG